MRQYTRRTYRKPKKYGSKWFGKRGSVYASAGRQLWKDVKYLKGLVNAETKFIDNAYTAQVISTTPSFYLMNGIGQGVTGNTREGISIRAKSLNVKMNVSSNATALSNVSRLIFFIDTQPNGLAPVVGDILQQTNVNGMRNLGNGYRFRILKDLRFTQVYSSESQQKTISVNIPLRFHTRYSVTGSTGTITDILTNSLYMMTIGDQAPATGALWAGDLRFRWIDN